MVVSEQSIHVFERASLGLGVSNNDDLGGVNLRD
jgi:hypothetical protein